MDFVIPKSPWELPEYVEAVKQETFQREAAFIDVTESVCGFELRQMLFRDYILLKVTGNPLLYGVFPTNPLQLIAFLWILSPGYSPTDLNAKGQFTLRCVKFLPPVKPKFKFKWVEKVYLNESEQCMKDTAEMVSAIRKYVEETLMDWPGSNSQGRDVNYYSDPIGVVAVFAREYGWSEEKVLALPMKRLFQYLREVIDHAPGVNPCFGNPSDKVKAEALRLINSRKN